MKNDYRVRDKLIEYHALQNYAFSWLVRGLIDEFGRKGRANRHTRVGSYGGFRQAKHTHETMRVIYD